MKTPLRAIFVGMCERPDPPVEGRRPRSRDGTVLRPPQLPGAPDPVATNGLIGINSRDYKRLELFTKLATSELPEHAPDSHILSFLRVVLRQCRRYNGGGNFYPQKWNPGDVDGS